MEPNVPPLSDVLGRLSRYAQLTEEHRADMLAEFSDQRRMNSSREEFIRLLRAWADIVGDNVRVQNGRVSAVVNWANAMDGDPLYDLARLTFYVPWYPEMQRVDIAEAGRAHYASQGARLRRAAARVSDAHRAGRSGLEHVHGSLGRSRTRGSADSFTGRRLASRPQRRHPERLPVLLSGAPHYRASLEEARERRGADTQPLCRSAELPTDGIDEVKECRDGRGIANVAATHREHAAFADAEGFGEFLGQCRSFVDFGAGVKGDFEAKAPEGAGAVFVLRARLDRLGDEHRWSVAQPYGGGGLVPLLSARSAGAEAVHLALRQ
jgi:hypothetical protein